MTRSHVHSYNRLIAYFAPNYEKNIVLGFSVHLYVLPFRTLPFIRICHKL